VVIVATNLLLVFLLPSAGLLVFASWATRSMAADAAGARK
jgi:hypothetical protein